MQSLVQQVGALDMEAVRAELAEKKDETKVEQERQLTRRRSSQEPPDQKGPTGDRSGPSL